MTRARRQVGEAARPPVRAAEGRGAGAAAVAAPGVPRTGQRGLCAAHRRVQPSGARAAPALGPGGARPRRAETSGSGFLPPPRGRRAAPLRGREAGAPGRGLAWQVTASSAYRWWRPGPRLSLGEPGVGARCLGDPFYFGLVDFSFLFLLLPPPPPPFLVRVAAECQVSRIPVRQSSPSQERTVGGCLASTPRVLTAKVEKC